MLNFNQSDTNTNFACQMDQHGPENPSSSPSCAVPSAYPELQQQQHHQLQGYPLMASFNNTLGTLRARSSSPGLHNDRFFDHTSIQDAVHQTTDTVFPFIMPSTKGSENVKRFSVNNLLQLAQCTSATNLITSGRSAGKSNKIKGRI